MGCVIGVSKRLGPARVLVGNAVSTNRDQRWSEGAKVGKTERRRGADGHKRVLGRGGHFNCGGVMVFYPLLAPRSWREWMRSELVQAFTIRLLFELVLALERRSSPAIVSDDVSLGHVGFHLGAERRSRRKTGPDSIKRAFAGFSLAPS